MKIMKFGGTSVGKPERMHQVSQLITKDEESTIVVLSALSGTTNALVGISNFLASSDKAGATNQIETLDNHYRIFILDLLKSEVYDLGTALEVPESILTAAPSDGLFGDARSDEDQIGASYPELEWAMKAVENGKTVNDFKGRERTVFEIYLRYNAANKHKMNPIPVCEIPNDLKN